MSRKELVLFGAGGHALSCIDVIETTELFQIIGIYEKKEGIIRNVMLDYKIIGKDNEYFEKIEKNILVLIAFGFTKDYTSRLKLINKLDSVNATFATVCSPHAYISKRVNIGEGTIVMHGSNINSGVSIAKNCIINSNSLIEHGCAIGSNSHISTGVILNGDVIVGENTFVGSGAIIFPGVTVPNNSVIPAGSVVKK